MLTYDDAFNVVRTYAHDMLPIFADRWSRWPEGAAAAKVAAKLRWAAKIQDGWAGSMSNVIRATADEVERRAGIGIGNGVQA